MYSNFRILLIFFSFLLPSLLNLSINNRKIWLFFKNLISLIFILDSEQIAEIVPLNLNKREQMVLGLIYLFYALENLAKIHNVERGANGGTGLFLNTVFIPKNYGVINDYLHDRLFIFAIEQIIKQEDPPPKKPLIKFENTIGAAEFNSKILEACNYDYEKFVSKQKDTTISYGSEFRSVSKLKILLERHENWCRFETQKESQSLHPLLSIFNCCFKHLWCAQE